jgi:hypothetical protein
MNNFRFHGSSVMLEVVKLPIILDLLALLEAKPI